MAQERSIEKSANDSSYNMNRHTLTGVPAGLYFGFDPVFNNDMVFRLNHNTTGFQETNQSGTLSSRRGMIKSRQGVVILESSDVSLNITPTGATTRRDAIVCSHLYQNISGGVSATYAIKPNIGTGEPTLTPSEILLGILELPINCTALNQTGVRYIRRQVLNLEALTTLVSGKYDIIQPAPITVNTFNTDWGQGFGNALLRFRKDQRGKVYLEGTAESQAVNPNVFILPEGYRPIQANHRSIISDNSGGVHVINISGITGQVSFSASPTASQIYWFNNISFFANA